MMEASRRAARRRAFQALPAQDSGGVGSRRRAVVSCQGQGGVTGGVCWDGQGAPAALGARRGRACQKPSVGTTRKGWICNNQAALGRST